MTSATDVRAWLVEHAEELDGAEIPGKGRIPKALQEVYDAAHPHGGDGAAGGAYPEESALNRGVGAGPAYDGGVTEADFPAAPESGEPHAPGTAGPDSERRPRRVGATRKQQAKTFRQRIWGGGSGAKRPAKKHPRMSLKGLIEDTWMDAAWTFQGLPPIEKVLYLQAPLAGQLLEDTVRDTAADKMLQPIARADRTFKAFEALTAPLWTGLIMVKGRRDEDGNYSPETKMMFAGLRHSLLAMTRAVDLDFVEMKVRSEELKGKSAQIDEMIAWLFEMPEPTPEQAAAMAGQAA